MGWQDRYEAYLQKNKEEEQQKKQEQQRRNPVTTNDQGGSPLRAYTEWKLRTGRIQEDVAARVEALAGADESFYTAYASRFGNRNGTDGGKYISDAAEQYQSAMQQRKQFDIKADSILQALDQYGEYFDQDWAASVRDYLGKARISQDRILRDYAADSQYWAQFGNEEGYLRYLNPEKYGRQDRQAQYAANNQRIEELKKQKAAVKRPENGYLTGGSMPQSSPYGAALQAPKKDPADNEITMLETWNRNYERGNGDYSKVIDDYADIAERDDFEAVSAKKDYGNPTKEDLFAYDRSASEGSLALSNGGYFDDLGNIVDRDGNIVQLADGDKIHDRLGLYLSATEEDKTEAYNLLSASNGNYTNTWANLIQTGDEGSWNQLSENEVAIYYYLLNNDGQETADKYLDDMKVELNRRQTQWESQEQARNLAEAGTLEKIMLNVATVPAQLLGGAVGFADDAINLIQGKDINPYSSRHALSNFGGTIREAQAAELETATNGAAIPFINYTVGDLYQSGMSFVDTRVGGLLGPNTYMALMGMGSASAEAKKLYEQGASNMEIAWGGALAGAAEMIFEKVSIDKLIDIKDPKTGWDIVKNILIQGGVEASEEVATEIANTITNALVMTDRSDWARLVEENNGDEFAAFKAKVADVGKAALGGFFSGAGSGGTYSVERYVAGQRQSAQTGQYIDEHLYGTDALMALAEEVAGYAPPKLQGRLEAQSGKLHDAVYDGNGNRGKAAGKLYGTVRTAITQQNQADIAKGLQELEGPEGKRFTPRQARAIAEAAAASMNGEKLTERQQKTLDRFQSDSSVRDVVMEVAGGEQATRLDAFHAAIATDTAKTFRGGAQPASQGATQTAPRAAEQADAQTPGNVYGTEKTPSQGRYEVSGSGSAQLLHTGEPVSIRSVAEIRDGKMTLELKDGRKVSAEEISYANEDEALVYEAVAEMGVDATAANVLVGAYHTDTGVSAEAYSLGVKEAYKYGQYNFPMQEVVNGPFSSMLTDHQRNTAYRLGQMFSEKQTAKAQAAVQGAATAEKNSTIGKVHFDGDYSKLNERQRTSLSALETVADVLGVQIHVFESRVDADGRRTGANGWYDATDSSIHIDLHSGVQGKDTMLFTAAHELSHFIRDWSPAKFKSLADFLVQEYGKQGISVDTLVQNQITKAKRNGRDISYDTAFEEVVADSMETMLSDGKVAEKLAKLKTQDKALWEKLKDFFRGLAEKIRAAYKGLKPDSVEGRYVAEMKDAVEQLQELFTEGLTDAGDNFQRAEKNTAKGGDVKYHARLSEKNPNYLDPRTVTKADVYDLLNSIASGQYNGKTYVPIRISTPGIVQERLFAQDCPMVMPVSKVEQAMKVDQGPQKGKNIRGHGFSAGDIVSIAEKMDSPDYLYSQDSNNRGIAVIKHEMSEGNVAVIVDFDCNINPAYLNGYEAGTYNVAVTSFDIDGGMVGLFQYAREKGWREVFNKAKEGDPAKKFPATRPFAIEQDSLNENVSRTEQEVNKKFSDRDQAMEKMNRVLTRENAKLKEDVGYLKEMLKLQRSVTGGTKFTKSSVEAMAGILMKNNSAKGSKAELAAHLNGLYEYIAKGEELTWEGVSEKAQPAVEWIQSHIESKPQMDEYATEILRKLRTSRVYLDESQKQEAAYLCGSYNDFRKRMLGTIVVSDKASVSLDTQWGELASLYPGVFDATTSASDMPRALMEAVDSLRGMNVVDEWYNRADVAQDLLRQVYDGYWKVSTLQTVADVKQKQINRLKTEHNARMEKIKSNHREKIDQLKTEHHNELVRAKVRYMEAGETVSKNKQRRIIEKQVKDLTKMIANPTKDAHVPTVLHKPLQKLLDSIDFTSERSAEGGEATVRDVAYTRALQSIRTAIAAQRTAMEGVEDGAFALDVPPEFLDKIDGHIKMINDATEGMDLTTNRVYDMSADELKDLAYLLGTINKAVRNIDKLHMEGAKARVSELAESTVREMGQRKPVKGEDGGGLMWANYTPTYAFERMGTAATQILDGLKQGQAKMARTVDGVLKFAAKTYDAKEVKAWQEKIHTVKLESGETVKLTTAQIMSFYCLSNRNQGVGHLTGGGIRVGTIGEGPGKTVQKQHFRLTVQDINQINGLLDKRQLDVAKAMQKYMQDVGGRLGNEISMARWGFMQMTEENYFPIRSDSDVHDGKNPDQEKANLWALLNKSFTKSVTKGANDAVVVSSIFDVFADHMAEMAEYNAFALPLVDAMKWYNYRSTTRMDGSQIETVGVKKSLNDTLGTAAGKYFIDLMTDINSSQKGGRHEDIMGKLLSYSKASSVGWNLRVAIQQPTAILRASLYLDMPDLARGSLRIGTKELVEEMQKYSGIAMWKSLGYYDLNVSRSVREQIKGNTNLVDTFNEWGMWLPGKVDEITWARIWAACKSKVSRTQNLKGEALLKETAKLFDDVVYHTQVVDSVLTKSSLMRSKSQIMKEFTSFMSEPTVSVNILMSAFQDYRQGKTNWEKAKRTFAICFKGYALSAMANALVTAFADAFRDDDEYEEFWEKYQQALLGEKFVDGNLFAELNPLEKLVFVKDALSLMRGYDVQNAYIKLAQGCIDLVNDIKKYLEGKGSITEYGVIYNALKVLGNFTGAAPANLARELVTIWNNTFGKLSGKKIHRYQTGVRDGIHNAFDAGTLTREEAIRELVLAQEAENEDEAYFQVKKWETGEDSKYDGLYEALEKNEGVDAAMKELTDHGVKEKDAVEAVRDKLKEWYIDPESEIQMSREETISRLEKYTDMGSDEIQALVKKWDMKKETGFIYDELREQYVDGNISEKEAIGYMQKYGGELKGDAEEKVLKWTCEKETGIAYDNLREEYVNNRVSKDKVVAYLQKYGGIYKANAEKTAREWTCEKETGIAYEDISSAYVTGKITASRAMDLRMLYGGYSREDARETVLEWQCEKDNGVKFDDIETAYKSGEISGSTAQKWLVKYGEQDPTDVAQKINAYDWQLAHPQYSLTVSQVISYTKQVEKLGYSIEYSGIDPETFVKYLNLSGKCKGIDSNGDGKADSGSIKQEIMDVIHSLPISSKQKDALYLYNGWSKSKLWQAPWH